jgi:hypothetical protein
MLIISYQKGPGPFKAASARSLATAEIHRRDSTLGDREPLWLSAGHNALSIAKHPSLGANLGSVCTRGMRRVPRFPGTGHMPVSLGYRAYPEAISALSGEKPADLLDHLFAQSGRRLKKK